MLVIYLCRVMIEDLFILQFQPLSSNPVAFNLKLEAALIAIEKMKLNTSTQHLPTNFGHEDISNDTSLFDL